MTLVGIMINFKRALHLLEGKIINRVSRKIRKKTDDSMGEDESGRWSKITETSVTDMHKIIIILRYSKKFIFVPNLLVKRRL